MAETEHEQDVVTVAFSPLLRCLVRRQEMPRHPSAYERALRPVRRRPGCDVVSAAFAAVLVAVASLTVTVQQLVGPALARIDAHAE